MWHHMAEYDSKWHGRKVPIFLKRILLPLFRCVWHIRKCALLDYLLGPKLLLQPIKTHLNRKVPFLRRSTHLDGGSSGYDRDANLTDGLDATQFTMGSHAPRSPMYQLARDLACDSIASTIFVLRSPTQPVSAAHHPHHPWLVALPRSPGRSSCLGALAIPLSIGPSSGVGSTPNNTKFHKHPC